MRSILIVLALIGGVISAHAGECFHSKQEIKEAHPGKYYRWDHRQAGHKGELCYYNTYAKASNQERKVMPTGTRSVHPQTHEARPLSATEAAQLLPLAWPDPRVIISPWVDSFQWMVGAPAHAGRIGQAFASLGFK